MERRTKQWELCEKCGIEFEIQTGVISHNHTSILRAYPPHEISSASSPMTGMDIFILPLLIDLPGQHSSDRTCGARSRLMFRRTLVDSRLAVEKNAGEDSVALSVSTVANRGTLWERGSTGGI